MIAAPATADAPSPPAPGVLRTRGRPRKTLDERDDGNRRQSLLRTAARLFRQQGFAATSTRDIAAAAGMRSGSPFYHFENKQALLAAVMQEGMVRASERQAAAVQGAWPTQPASPSRRRPAGGAATAAAGAAGAAAAAATTASSAASAVATATAAPVATPAVSARERLRVLVRSHLDVLLGPDSDFIPVMLYEWRSLSDSQRAEVKRLKDGYEAVWVPVLRALRDSGELKGDPGLSRLMIFGALNWTVQWYDPKRPSSLDDLAEAALQLFLKDLA